MHVRLALAGSTGLEAAVRDLTAREADCCSFFTFTVVPSATLSGEALMLEIEVPAEYADVLEALARRARDASVGPTEPKESVMQRISRDGLLALLETDEITLVEALPEVQYVAEHLPGAVNLPGELTPEIASEIAPDRDRTVVTYCSGPSCNRSKVAAAAFVRLGYADVRIYAGGKVDWANGGLPLRGTRDAVKAA